MIKKVQAIIFKDNKVLLVNGVDENGRKRNYFISGDLNKGENENDAIKRILKEQINIDCNITLKFNRESIDNVCTFLIDLNDKEISIDYDIKNIECINENYSAVDLTWVELNDRRTLREFETRYIKLTLEQCIVKDYNAPWVNLIKNTYFNSSMSQAYLNDLIKINKRNLVDSKESLSKKIIVMFIALGIGILFNYFFIWKSIGISGSIFSMVILLGSVYAVYENITLKKKISWIFLIPIILLSLTFTIYNNPILIGLNVIIIPFLIVSYLISIRYENIKEININFIEKVFQRVFVNSFSTLPKFFKFSKEIVSSKKKIKENSTRKNIIKGLIISLPLLVVIVLLLTSADMMFKYYIENIGNGFEDINIGELIPRFIIITIVTLYMFGFIWSFKYNDVENNYIKGITPTWEPVTIITIIFVINIAYLLFSIVQFSYLYGGGLNALPEGFSYAEYARKGFFELILITLINFGILILSINFTKKENKKVNYIAKISYTLLILFTSNMLFSAFYKMNLYEKAYGYTRLRIFVLAFMVLIGTLLIIVLLGVWIKRLSILKYALISTIIVYVGLNYINVDKIIAKNNILRYEETDKIDISYIKLLSYDAYPEIAKLLDPEANNVKDMFKEHTENKIEEHFKNKMKNLDSKHWYEFNYYKNKFLKFTKERYKVEGSK